MNAEDAVRIFNLLGSVVLFFGALRGQRWTKKQADTQEDAARNLLTPSSVPQQPPAQKAAQQEMELTRASEHTQEPKSAPARHPVLAEPGKFQKAAADIAARPYFDRPAYWLFCLGFFITTLASAIDLYHHYTLSHLPGAVSQETECKCVATENPSSH